jgi:hypothetical protein
MTITTMPGFLSEHKSRQRMLTQHILSVMKSAQQAAARGGPKYSGVGVTSTFTSASASASSMSSSSSSTSKGNTHPLAPTAGNKRSIEDALEEDSGNKATNSSVNVSPPPPLDPPNNLVPNNDPPNNLVVLPNDSFPTVPANILTLPIEDQVKLVVNCFNKEKANIVMGKIFAVGYSLGTSIRVANIGGSKVLQDEEDVAVEAEEPTTKKKKVDKLLEMYGEGGVRIDALSRMICHALVTHCTRFGDKIDWYLVTSFNDYFLFTVVTIRKFYS